MALEVRRTWEEAKNYCDAQQPGLSTLAIVPASNYNEFIFSHMMGTNNNVWIGAKADQDRNWFWEDNKTPFIFTFWAPERL